MSKAYDAVSLGDGQWMVHWNMADGKMVEASIRAPEGVVWTEHEAIMAAIARGSWA